jgi:5-formyltetrahydrofolate cyclo-ligase
VSPSISAEKELLRRQILAARIQLSEPERAEATAAITGHGIDTWLFATTVAAYLGVGTEPATMPLVSSLHAAGVHVLLPVIHENELDWALFRGPEELTAGPLGISEPTGPRLGASAPATADVVLVPALAADPAGHRLGRGRGYYDRALSVISAPVVAVLYDHELVAVVPTEPHDRPINGVLRPAGFQLLP